MNRLNKLNISMKYLYLFLLLLSTANPAAAQEADSVFYGPEQRRDIADYSEQFFNKGELMKKTAKNNIVVMMSLEPTNDFGKLYRLYVSIYNNTDKTFDVLDRDIRINGNYKGKTENCEIITAKEYKQRIKNRGIAYELLVGDLDDVVFGRNPDVQRSVTTRNRDNRGGGDDTLFMSRSKNFRNETAASTRINYGRANRYMLHQVADNSDWVNGIKGIMSDEYFRSNTLTPQERFTSGYIVFKRKKADEIKVTLEINGTEFHFSWNENELIYL